MVPINEKSVPANCAAPMSYSANSLHWYLAIICNPGLIVGLPENEAVIVDRRQSSRIAGDLPQPVLTEDVALPVENKTEMDIDPVEKSTTNAESPLPTDSATASERNTPMPLQTDKVPDSTKAGSNSPPRSRSSSVPDAFDLNQAAQSQANHNQAVAEKEATHDSSDDAVGDVVDGASDGSEEIEEPPSELQAILFESKKTFENKLSQIPLVVDVPMEEAEERPNLVDHVVEQNEDVQMDEPSAKASTANTVAPNEEAPHIGNDSESVQYAKPDK